LLHFARLVLAIMLLVVVHGTGRAAMFVRYDFSGTLPTFETQGPDGFDLSAALGGTSIPYSGYVIFDVFTPDTDSGPGLEYVATDFLLNAGNLNFTRTTSTGILRLNPSTGSGSFLLNRTFDLVPLSPGLEETSFQFNFTSPVLNAPVVNPLSAGNFSVLASVANTSTGGTAGRFSLPGAVPSFTASTYVPEPSSWLLLIAGFGLVGGALRRRPAALEGRLLPA
jgi:hypothetical protein